jgi:hypothetical protein
MKVTRHAKIKFLLINRIIKNEGELTEELLSYAGKEILRLFKYAEFEDPNDNPGLIRRIIENDFEDSKYYRNDDIRFVVCDNSIVTVERNQFRKRVWKIKKKRKKR